ncbi:MAG: Rdx family protein [Deltaproteobacteria bacterium]|nr:Rdx family protein [Deltaproteobacteria bacterium]
MKLPPRATSLVAAVKARFPDADITLIEGSKGIFDIKIGDTMIFSKYDAGRFPEHDEILDLLAHHG